MKDKIDNLIINSNYNDDIKNTLFILNEMKKEAIKQLVYDIAFKDYIIDYRTEKIYQIKRRIGTYYEKSGRKSIILKQMMDELDNVAEQTYVSVRKINSNHLSNFNRMLIRKIN